MDEQLQLLINTFATTMGENGFDGKKRLVVAGYLATRDSKLIEDLAKDITDSGNRPSLILQYVEDILRYAKDLDPDWEVTIRETLEKKVIVKAPSRIAAMEIAKNGYDDEDCEFLLDEDDDFKCIDFDAVKKTSKNFSK